MATGAAQFALDISTSVPIAVDTRDEKPLAAPNPYTTSMANVMTGSIRRTGLVAVLRQARSICSDLMSPLMPLAELRSVACR